MASASSSLLTEKGVGKVLRMKPEQDNLRTPVRM